MLLGINQSYYLKNEDVLHFSGFDQVNGYQLPKIIGFNKAQSMRLKQPLYYLKKLV